MEKIDRSVKSEKDYLDERKRGTGTYLVGKWSEYNRDRGNSTNCIFCIIFAHQQINKTTIWREIMSFCPRMNDIGATPAPSVAPVLIRT